MSNPQEFQKVFDTLKEILLSYQPQLSVKTDEPQDYALDTISKSFRNKPLFFGGVHIKKNYVSYYLMPLYVFTDLLSEVSPQLKKRMQGKSCFNFKTLDKELFSDLEVLTRKGFERYQSEGLL